MVIPVKPGDVNDELRWTLRSFAANLPHDRIWVVGYRPSWLVGVHHIPTTQNGSKYTNTTRALWAACQHPEVAGRFLYANDDMFAMRPITFLPVYHRGKVREVDAAYRRRGIASSAWLRGMRATAAALAGLGHPDPWSYEVHVPMPVWKAGMIEALTLVRGVPAVHKRTVYGTLAGVGGRYIRDPKLTTASARPDPDATWLSTMDTSWYGAAGRHIRARFPRRCRYEKVPAHARPVARRRVGGGG